MCPVSREELLPDGKRIGVEKVDIGGDSAYGWVDHYCGFHVHEIRFFWRANNTDYKVLTAATLHQIALPMDFMFKIVKYEVVHHTSLGVASVDGLFWYIRRSREGPGGSQVFQTIRGGDKGPVTDLIVNFDETFIYPPTLLILGFQCGAADTRVYPTLTVQVTY